MKSVLKRMNRQAGGFTLVETLVVVAVITVLSAIAIPSLVSMQRSTSMAKLDRSARAIYMVAQNRLQSLASNGQLAKNSEAVKAIESSHAAISSAPSDYPVSGVEWTDSSGKLYYGLYYLNSSDDANSAYLVTDATALGLSGILDSGGSYVIELSPETGEVYSVFYSDKPGLTYQKCPTSDRSLSHRTDEMIGYYSGGELSMLATEIESALPDLSFEVENREELYVSITANASDGTSDFSNPSVQINQGDLKITVLLSDAAGHSWSKTLVGGTGPDADFNLLASQTRIDVILDSMSDDSLHFANLVATDGTTTSDAGFVPGENVTVSVSAKYGGKTYDNTTNAGLANKLANSLFAGIAYTESGTGDLVGTCTISSVRHLNNLRSEYFNAASYTSSTGQRLFSSIKQVGDIIFDGWAPTSVAQQSLDASGNAENPLAEFEPIMSDDAVTTLAYDGQGNVISDFVITGNGQTGLFATKGGSVSDLVLSGFAVTGTGSAAGASTGTLAGTCTASVTNVYAKDCSVLGTSNTGGLVGAADDASFLHCGVYLSDHLDRAIVQSGEYSAIGGLAGWAEGSSSFSYCFAAEPVQGFAYAGGFIGSSVASGAITGCYSSCSVSASNSTAGGFAARLTGTVSDCYTTSDVSSEVAAGFVCIAGASSSGNTACSITGSRSYGAVSGADAAGFVGTIENGAAVSGSTYLSMYGYNTFDASDGNVGASYASMRASGNTPDETHPYSDALSGKAYPFSLCSYDAEGTTQYVPHYGDWPVGISITWKYDDDTNGGAILKTYEVLSGSTGPSYNLSYWANAKTTWVTDGYDPMPHKDRADDMVYAVYRFTGFGDPVVDADGNQVYYAQFERCSYEQVAKILVDEGNPDNLLWSKYLLESKRYSNYCMKSNVSVDSEASMANKNSNAYGQLAHADERELTYLSKEGVYVDQISFTIALKQNTYPKAANGYGIGYNTSNKGYAGNFVVYVSDKITLDDCGTRVAGSMYDVGLAGQGSGCYFEGTLAVIEQDTTLSGNKLKTPVLQGFTAS